MSYNAFLFILSQLAGKRKARVVIRDQVVFIEASETKEEWTLSTKIYQGEGYIPHAVRDCVSSRGSLHWRAHDAYLKLDAESSSVHLRQLIRLPKSKYLPFRDQFNDFLSVVKEWKEILDGQAESDYCPIRL